MKETERTRDCTLEEFIALLERCKAQVEADPEGYTANPHLYELLHGIYLRLCHGNVPDHAGLNL